MTGGVRARLAVAGLEIPPAPVPVGSYVPALVSAGMVFTSGQLPLVEGSLYRSGTVGADVAFDDAVDCARIAALNALAAVSTVADLDSVKPIRLVVYVASAPGFHAQPGVANGASDVLAAAFGGSGAHVREAVGVAALPLAAPVEVSLVLEMSTESG